MLGRTLVRELGSEFEVVPTDLPEADITDEVSLDAVFGQHAPDAVIHCAAMTAVDRCETERDLAFRLNARGTANVAALCNRRGIRLIAISTDYVFDGDSYRPYNEFDRATGGNDPGTGIFPAQPEYLTAALGFGFGSHSAGVDHDQIDRDSRIVTNGVSRLCQTSRQQGGIGMVEAAPPSNYPG